MKVLIACEESKAVCKEIRRMTSLDITEAEIAGAIWPSWSMESK